MPYLKGDAPSQLDVYVPKITRAYITSRLESGARPLALSWRHAAVSQPRRRGLVLRPSPRPPAPF